VLDESAASLIMVRPFNCWVLRGVLSVPFTGHFDFLLDESFCFDFFELEQ
jgi:hypothetical protein